MESAGRSLTKNLIQNQSASVKPTLTWKHQASWRTRGQLASPGPSEHLTSFPVLKFSVSEAKDTGDSGRQHKPATKALLVLRQNPASL